MMATAVWAVLLAFATTCLPASDGARLGARRLISPGVNVTQCPPPDFATVPDLNLSTYTAAPWYPQKQIPQTYQPVDELYCVRAVYTFLDSDNATAGILVDNYANQGQVNGPPLGIEYRMVAYPESNSNSKLLVGPQGAPRNAFGHYWVVAVGPSTNTTTGYDWVIVSGGLPDYPSEGACLPRSTTSPFNRTKTTYTLAREQAGYEAKQEYDSGLWLMSRMPEDPSGVMLMEQKAKDLGFDTSKLKDVKQKGCMYQRSQ